MKPISDLAADFRRLGAEGYLGRHPYAVIVHLMSEEPEGPAAGFNTGHISSAERPSLPMGGAARAAMAGVRLPAALSGPGRVLFYPIVKRADGVFRERISVGRTRNTDVCLPSVKVSKLQAYFTTSSLHEPRYYLSDAGSTNGTFVNDAALDRERPVALADGDSVRFSDLTFLFYTPRGLCRLLFSS